jgi:hypothetical protein
MAPDDVGLAISQFIRRLPSPDPNDPMSMPSLAVAHIVSHAAMVRLCARSSPTQTMDSRALEASLSCARMIHLLTVSDFDMWSLDIVLCVSDVSCFMFKNLRLIIGVVYLGGLCKDLDSLYQGKGAEWRSGRGHSVATCPDSYFSRIDQGWTSLFRD